MTQLFQQLGSALESGNLSDAKEALAQLQKNAPAQAGTEKNPINAKMATLGQAVDSGDMKAAQEAYNDIKNTISQHPGAGGRQAGGPGGVRPAGGPRGGAPHGGAKESSGTKGSSSSNKVYDKKDTNKDGTVSAMEEIVYDLVHPDEAKQASAPGKTATDGNSVDVTV
jgi:hypothetical protein